MLKLALWLSDREWGFLYMLRKLHSLTDSKTYHEYSFGELLKGAVYFSEIAISNEKFKTDFVDGTTNCANFLTINAQFENVSALKKKIVAHREEEFNRSISLGKFPKGNFILTLSESDVVIFEALSRNGLDQALDKKKGISPQELIKKSIRFIYDSPNRFLEFASYTFLGNLYRFSIRQTCEVIRLLSDIKMNGVNEESENSSFKLAVVQADRVAFEKAKIDCSLVNKLMAELKNDGLHLNYAKYNEVKSRYWSSIEDFNLFSSIFELRMVMEMSLYPGKWVTEFAFTILGLNDSFLLATNIWKNFMIMVTCGANYLD